ncbi:MAG TPA: VTT domain-containing protein [Vicinamibacteria bacterium]|jgi:membrane protein DedA with SNARE-associated domain|nr:VTT domain-containing protein [Vicinamibacteria bacterium]
MTNTVAFLLRHGYALLFSVVLLEELGLPLPALPLLLAAGALAGAGRLSFAVALLVSAGASLAGDLVWFEAGRRRGASVLNLLCRISLEPDSCVRKTEDVFGRQGARALLLAKFVPGLGTVAPPLAGIFQMRLTRFLAYDAAASLLWAGGYMTLGYLFRHSLTTLAHYVARTGGTLAAVVGLAAFAYVAWKYVQRRRFLADLRVGRITPEELKAKLEAGEDLVIVDLRHSLDFEADPRTLPRSLRLTAEELEIRHHEIPRDRDVVLYCT